MAANVIRELLVRLGVNVSPQTKQQIKQFDQSIEKLKTQMRDAGNIALWAGKRLVAFAIAGAGALGALTVKTGQNAIEVERQAKALGVTREQYQELAYVADQYGSTTKELSRALLALDRASVRARAGSKGSAQAFAELGIHTRDLRGLDPAQLLDRVADGAGKAGDRTKALAALSTLLGSRIAQRLAPALLSGADGMAKLKRQAHELGLVMSDQQLATVKESAVQWRLLKAAGQGVANLLAVSLAPLVTRVLRGINGWVRANRELLSQRLEFWVRQVTRAIDGANAAVKLIGGWDVVFLNVATGAGLIWLIANLERVEQLLGLIRVGFVAVGVVAEPVLDAMSAGLDAVGIGLAPVALILGAILAPMIGLGLAADDFLTFWRGGKSVLGDNLDLLQRYIPAFGGVRDLVGALVGLGGSAWQSITILARAVGVGLAPAFDALASALQPVLDKLTVLKTLWDALNIMAGAPLEAAAAWIRALGAGAVGTAAGVAPVVSRGVATSVQNQVSRVTNSSSTDNSTRAVSQTNNFLGGGSATDHLRAMDPALRHARLAVAGGRR